MDGGVVVELPGQGVGGAEREGRWEEAHLDGVDEDEIGEGEEGVGLPRGVVAHVDARLRARLEVGSALLLRHGSEAQAQVGPVVAHGLGGVGRGVDDLEAGLTLVPGNGCRWVHEVDAVAAVQGAMAPHKPPAGAMNGACSNTVGDGLDAALSGVLPLRVGRRGDCLDAAVVVEVLDRTGHVGLVAVGDQHIETARLLPLRASTLLTKVIHMPAHSPTDLAKTTQW
jgi:hypothetical protein